MNIDQVLLRLREILDWQLFEITGTPIRVATLVVALIVFAISLLVARLAERLVLRAFAHRGSSEQGSIAVAGRLLYYSLAILGLMLAINTVGIQLSALFAAGAFLAVGIGFGLQNIVQNFFSGIILLGERSIKPGDVLEVEGRMVRITHMGLRAAVARTLDEEDVIIPNSLLVQSSVINLTMRDQVYRIRVPVGVTYDSDLDRVFAVLEETARRSADDDSPREPAVLLTGFGASSIDFEVSLWINDPWRHRSRKSAVMLAIWRAFRDQGIVIAFPQLDVHFDREAVEAWKAKGLSAVARAPSPSSPS